MGGLTSLFSWIDAGEITLVGLLGGFIVAYLTWWREIETIDDRRVTIRENLVGNEYSLTADKYLVTQVDYIEEENSILYRLKKAIPHLRDFHGWTKLTIRSEGAPSRSYVWAEDDVGEDFPSYLKEICDEDYPEVIVTSPEFNSDSSVAIEEVRLKIHSLDVTMLSKVVNQIPVFHEYYFNNYPGDSRFQLPS